MKHAGFFVTLFLVLLTCQVYSETFENGPAGMRVDYSITGLSLSAPQDNESLDREGSGNVYFRDYQVKYKTKGGRVTFTGRVSDANASSGLAEYLEVYLACINKDDTWGPTSVLPALEQKGMAKSYFMIAPSQAGSFSLAIDVPPGYKVCFMLYLFRSPNDYDTTNYNKSLYDSTPLNDHRSLYGYNVLAIYGLSSDAPEWTTIVEPQSPTTTVTSPYTTTITPPPPPQPNIGGFALTIALVAATAAIVAAAVKSGKKPKPDEVLRYILQLSTNRIDFSTGHPATFDASVWKVVAGSPTPLAAPGAAISITLPDGCKELQVTPLTGLGTIHCLVSMVSAFTDPVTLTIEAQEGGTSTNAEIEVLPPALEIAALFEPEDDSARWIRAFDDLAVAKDEFVANGEDKAKAILYVRVKGDTRPPRDQVIKEAEFITVNLDGSKIEMIETTSSIGFIRYLVEEDAEDKAFNADRKNNGCHRVSIRAMEREPMLYTAVNAGHILNIHALARVLPAEGKGGLGRLVVCNNIRVNPLFYFLKLWVIPGRLRDQSEAWTQVYFCSGQSRSQWAPSNVELELRITQTGQQYGSSLSQLEIMDDVSHFTDGDGRAHWELKYCGINWDNFENTVFKVICRVNNCRQWVAFIINIAQNLRDMLNACKADKDTIRTDNPEYAEGSSSMGSIATILSVPSRRILGPINNLYEISVNGIDPVAPAHPELRTYVCTELSVRILDWATMRRFGQNNHPETSLTMNGIEFAPYVFTKAHYMCGFHLSGDPLTRDPRFIDPWWNQRFDDNVILTYRNEVINITYAGSLMSTMAFAFFEIIYILAGKREAIKTVDKVFTISLKALEQEYINFSFGPYYENTEQFGSELQEYTRNHNPDLIPSLVERLPQQNGQLPTLKPLHYEKGYKPMKSLVEIQEEIQCRFSLSKGHIPENLENAATGIFVFLEGLLEKKPYTGSHDPSFSNHLTKVISFVTQVSKNPSMAASDVSTNAHFLWELHSIPQEGSVIILKGLPDKHSTISLRIDEQMRCVSGSFQALTQSEIMCGSSFLFKRGRAGWVIVLLREGQQEHYSLACELETPPFTDNPSYSSQSPDMQEEIMGGTLSSILEGLARTISLQVEKGLLLSYSDHPSAQGEMPEAETKGQKAQSTATPSPLPPLAAKTSRLACPRCGTLIKESDRFCSKCGAPYVAPPAPESAAPHPPAPDSHRHCIKCSSALKKEAKFCNACGTRNEPPAPPQSPPPTPVKSICAKCGARLKQNDKFCMVCGAKCEPPARPTPPQPQTTPMPPPQKPVQPVCAKCGTHLKQGDKFCMKCGAKCGSSPPGSMK